MPYQGLQISRESVRKFKKTTRLSLLQMRLTSHIKVMETYR